MTRPPRRVVTGVDAAGRAAVLSDAPAGRTHDYAHIPSMGTSMLWATLGGESGPHTGDDPTPVLVHDLPGPGETRFLFVRFPPDAVYADPGFDPAAAGAETRRVSPDLASHLEPEHPGMHATATVDYVVVLDGPIRLELDDGAVVDLAPGDVVVQCGNRHAWRNPGPDPVTLAVVHVAPPAPGSPPSDPVAHSASRHIPSPRATPPKGTP